MSGHMQKIKVVAFDCDGVMFDTEKANKAFYNHILNHFGLPEMTPEQFTYAGMHTADKVLAYLFDDPETLEAAREYRLRMTYIPFIKYMEIEPNLKAVLKRLRPKYQTAIATNRTDSIDYVLKEFGLGKYFDFVVSALDVDQPKPHPEPLFKILEHFQIKPDQTIYVGDSELDEIAARAAGMVLVAYNNRSLKTDFHIQNLAELEKVLAK